MPVQSIIKKQLSQYIVEQAKEIGFLDCGISKAEHLPQEEASMENWLANGNNGQMSYLERNKDLRYNPTLLVENAKSVITILFNYFPEEEFPDTNNFKISKYAYGIDYHYVIKEKLKLLDNLITKKAGPHNSRIFVDSAPVLDRTWAHKSNLGFIGKNTLLINKKVGSFFFIGHIISDIILHYNTTPPSANYCGNCTKCIDACPTQAIKDGYVDARLCISYLTIEYRGELETNLKEKFNNRIFGCDTCQDVCPWNRFSKPHNEPLFEPSEELKTMKLTDWQTLSKPQFKLLFKGSAVNRTRYVGLKRNIDFLKSEP